MHPEPLLVVLMGPTASGKTALSLRLAAEFHGEIVNCDSVAMYREFEIGTAKPGREQYALAPHHLFDCVEPSAYITAGDYSRRAREVIAEIGSKGALPIVVGGTGLYLRALLDGLFSGPERSEYLRKRLRERIENRGGIYLHRLLKRLDPAAAAAIHENDTPKLIRAIEVCAVSRQKMSDLWKKGADPLKGFRILRLGLNPDRPLLYERINQRAKQMFDCGLIEETQDMLNKYGDSAAPFGALGYRQALQVIRGEIDSGGAISAVQQAHRNYAKRQMTWFRREPGVVWLEGFGDELKIQEKAIGIIQEKITIPN